MNDCQKLLYMLSHIPAYETKIAKNIQKYVDDLYLYQLPIENICNIMRQLSFADSNQGVEIIKRLVSNACKVYPDKYHSILNAIPSGFNDMQVSQILSAVRSSSTSTTSSNPQSKYESKSRHSFINQPYIPPSIAEVPKPSPNSRQQQSTVYKQPVAKPVRRFDPSEAFKAVKSGDINLFKTMIQSGINPNQVDEKGKTFLHYAAKLGYIDIFRYLVYQLHCKVDQLDKNDKTPLMNAAKKGQLEVLKYLHQHGANIMAHSNFNWYPIHTAAKWGNTNILEYMINNRVPVDLKEGQDDRTPFFCACERGQLDAARILLQYGADINAQSKKGMTPLHQAAYKNEIGIIQFLIENDAELNIRNNYGQTPLDSARRGGNSEAEELISDAGGKSGKKSSRHTGRRREQVIDYYDF